MCPTVATCKGSVLDYFVIDRRLAHAVLYVKRLDNFGFNPHCPVRLALMAEPRRLMVRTLIAPQRIPAVLPAGCLTREQSEYQMRGGVGAGGIGTWLGEWTEAAEKVGAAIGGKGGKEEEKSCGRARGPRLVWKSALGPPADKRLFSTVVARSWSKLAGWCAAIRRAGEHGEARHNGQHPLAKAAQVAHRRVRAAAKWSWEQGEQREGLLGFLP